MQQSRTQSVTKNVSMAMIAKYLDQILTFVVRTVFIKTLSVEYLGVNGLFTNILSFLSLAELGVGSAIVYLMYSPIAKNDIKNIQKYMQAYKTIYRVIGIVVLVIGIGLTPFLDFFIASAPDIHENIEFIYLLYVARTVSSYFFAYKQSIFTANQQGYIINQNTAIFSLIRSILEVIFLLTTRNFIVYLIISVGVNYLQNIVISIKADKAYPYLRQSSKTKLDKCDKEEIRKNIGAMFFHKIGAVVLNSSDNIILSKFIGLVTVGLYSNYSVILISIRSVLWTIFDAIVPSVGNLCAQGTNDQKYSVFKSIHLMNLWVSGFCTIGLGVLFNPFITLWIGKEYLLSEYTVWAIVFSYYVQTNMRAIEMFRSATGLFYRDRYVPLVQCVINIVISIVMVKFWGVAGIFVGTTCSILFTGFWVQPFMVFKYIFRRPVLEYFLKYIKCTILTIMSFVICYYISTMLKQDTIFLFIIRLLICTIIPNVIFLIFYYRTEEFQIIKNKIIGIVSRFSKGGLK